MVDFSINNNVLSKLVWNKKNVIFPWGIEFADDNSFFSLEKGMSQRVKILEEKYQIIDNQYYYLLTIQMSNGLFKIEGIDKITEEKITRKLNLIALKDSLLLDFVMRFRFDKDFYNVAEIAGHTIQHSNTNRYYQYDCKYVKLSGDMGEVTIKINNDIKDEKWNTFMYARDNKNEWIVHARMLPTEDKNIVIKLCSRWFKSKPLPAFFCKILSHNKKIYSYLKYHNEIKPYHNLIARTFNLNAYPMVKLAKGQQLEFEAEVLHSDKNNHHKRVSVIIPTYNRPDYLDRLLYSMLESTDYIYEVIIIDDNSNNKDEYIKVINKHRVFFNIIFKSNKQNMGAPFCRNYGIKIAKMDFLAFSDDDDEWIGHKLEKQMVKMKANVGLVYTWAATIDETNNQSKFIYNAQYQGDVITQLLMGNFIPSSSVLIRKEAIIEAGLFDEKMPSCQDWDMWIRIAAQKYEFDVVSEILLKYYKHTRDSIGKSSKAQQGYRMFYKKHIKHYSLHFFFDHDFRKYVIRGIRRRIIERNR